MTSLTGSLLLDLLKEKANVMNEAYQRFQADLHSAMDKLLQCEAGMKQKSLYESKIQYLLSNFSFEMNRIETSYFERFESSLQTVSSITMTPPQNIPQLTSFRRSPMLDSHQSKYQNQHQSTSNPNKDTECNICGKQCFQKSDLYKHLRNIHKVPPFHCDVAGCDASFDWARDLKQHQKVQHSKGSIITFKSESSVQQGGYQCDRCSRWFSSKGSYGGHRAHCRGTTNDKFIPSSISSSIPSCAICGEHFKRKSDLYSHLRDHHNIAPFKCDITGCGFRFFRFRELEKHQKCVHFTKNLKWTLEMTSNEHETTNSVRKQQNECKECIQFFGSASALKIHYIQVHTEERPFLCDYNGCDESFKLQKNLYYHIRTKHDGYPYLCPDPRCQETFNYQNEMNAHWKMTHLSLGIDGIDSTLSTVAERECPRKRRRMTIGTVLQIESKLQHQCNPTASDHRTNGMSQSSQEDREGNRRDEKSEEDHTECVKEQREQQQDNCNDTALHDVQRTIFNHRL